MSDEACIPVEEDVKLLKELEEDSVATIYVGTVRSVGAYKDVYIVLKVDRTLHVVELRRLCYTSKQEKE